LLSWPPQNIFVSYPNPQKSRKYQCVEVALGDDPILNKNRWRANSAGHEPGWIIPSISIIFRATAQSDADAILLFASTSPANALHIISARRRRISQKNFLEISDIDTHFESGGATEEIDAFIAKFVFDLLRQILLNLGRVFLGL
jgi:hypothetical protein